MPTIGSTTRQRLYVGVDPGASGGISTIRGNVVRVYGMPDTERGIWDLLGALAKDGASEGGVFGLIEKVWGHIGSGGDGERGGGASNGSAMFKFGYNAGLLRMALVGSGIPHEDKTPQAWQKIIGVPGRKKGEKKPEFKRRLKQKAEALFPTVHSGSITLQTCDSLLIAEVCRRMREWGGK